MEYQKSSREGAFLEKVVGSLFNRAGFITKINHIEYVDNVKNEVDVLVETSEGEKIIVECKQRRDENTGILKGYLDKLIGQKVRLKADKALLVTNASIREEYASYKANGVYFWDGEELNRLQSLTDDKLSNAIYKNLQLEPRKGAVFLAESSNVGKLKQVMNIAIKNWKYTLIGFAIMGVVIYIYWEPIVTTISFVITLVILGVFLGVLCVVNALLNKLSGPEKKTRKKKKKRRVKKVVYYE